MPDLGVMEEAFRYGALNHLLANGKGIFPPLAVPAAAWAKTNHFRQLYVSLLTLAAENHLVLGQTQQAMALLDEARTAIGNRTMAGGRLGARRMFLAATALYQARKTAEGDAVLAKVMHFMRTGSLWLFHIQKVDDYYTGGGNGGVNPARAAIDLYPIVLRDPQPADWLTDPMESLAVAVGAARPDLRALVRSGRRPQGPRTGHRSGRPCPAASLSFHACRWAGGWSRCAGCWRGRRNCCRRRP